MFWGVSNVLGCFECFGGVSNVLGCFECFGGVLECFR